MGSEILILGMEKRPLENGTVQTVFQPVSELRTRSCKLPTGMPSILPSMLLEAWAKSEVLRTENNTVKKILYIIRGVIYDFFCY
jgi:hypothetical protein